LLSKVIDFVAGWRQLNRQRVAAGLAAEASHFNFLPVVNRLDSTNPGASLPGLDSEDGHLYFLSGQISLTVKSTQ
ncbi:MAG TPA: hypothetical protein PLW30_08360, partial [Candidatus Saccharicenans sp.]|nr:hypothetical protein [Candidatus Saccharicenans sp.]